MTLPSPNRRLASYSVLLIPLSIFVAKTMEAILRSFDVEFASPTDEAGNRFVSNFIEWFGVLYGILLPLILVRVWEQLDEIDREFDREADAVRIFYEDLSYLPGKTAKIGEKIASLLYDYVLHVIAKYPNEVKQSGYEMKAGDKILETIREQFRYLIHPSIMETKVLEFLIRELFERLNEIIDIRGDRIALASQRLFQSLRFVALITSIIFLLPFYFAGLTTSPAGLLDIVLIVGVTLLVIFIYMIIDDLDGPFDGTWKITDESWRRILEDMDINKGKSTTEKGDKKNILPKIQTKKSNTKSNLKSQRRAEVRKSATRRK